MGVGLVVGAWAWAGARARARDRVVGVWRVGGGTDEVAVLLWTVVVAGCEELLGRCGGRGH